MDQYSREFIAEKARLRLDRFDRATRELGRVFKTEFILDYLSQPALRTRIRRGLLKGEQLDALARCVHYGPTGPTGSARLRTPNRRGELPASHPRSYHLLADSGDRSCLGESSRYAAPTLRYGPAGDSAPRLRLRRLVWPKGSFRRVRPFSYMNDNILYHALARPRAPRPDPPLSPRKQRVFRIGPEPSRARSGEANP